MGNLQLDANAARIFLAQRAGELQKRFPQALFAIDRHEVGDDLLLVSNADGEVANETFKQRVPA